MRQPKSQAMSQPTTPSIQALDALLFPLHGSRLIEASAGTGKTWTIAALYLRLVLGHGTQPSDDGHVDTTAFARPLLPAEILVMTFTRAATRELSDRIRARLIEAARGFRDPASVPADDTLLTALLADYPDEAQRTQAAWRLAMAAEGMDEAAIFTIDAWCQRMLREHAFDSGNPFDETLATDEDGLLLEATQDYWRQHCYPLNPDALESLLDVWSDLGKLHEDMRTLVGETLVSEDADESLGACIERVTKNRNESLMSLSQDWSKHAKTMRKWLDNELATNAKAWNGRRLQTRYYASALDALEHWAEAPQVKNLDKISDAARFRLTPAGLQDARKDVTLPFKAPKVFAAFEALLTAYEALPNPKTPLRIHAATRIQQRLALLKRRARSFGFADMLARLDHALSGEHGERLRARILAQYPVALIDEFQDTSPLQYRLFDALYRTADNDAQHGLFLIGDPKQSIYGFRGADIYSYLQARRATQGRHYALDTNYRSTQAMVEVVNAWFGQAEARKGSGAEGEDETETEDDNQDSGAFLFRRGADNELPFEAVKVKGRAERFRTAQGPVPALHIQHDLDLLSGTDMRPRFAARCAEQIVSWLNDEAAGFDHPSEGFTRLRPADIAILVRTGTEASAVRNALRKRGVASVYLSDKDSVFASDEARDLLRWLRAVAAPLDGQLVRAALATPTLGLSLEELAQLAHDDAAFDARSEDLRELNTTWRTLGVLTMLRRSLHLLKLPARWLAQADGERRLTNYLHLAELLQQASAQLDGEQALIRWLATQIETGSDGGEEQVVRLESDADLVKVITIFKSKGLEYPVVCLPFACSFRQVDKSSASALKLADASGARALKLDYDESDVERADHERLREGLRLFYVALTRARHALWLGFSAVKIGNGNSCMTHRSAPGYLLGGLAQRSAVSWLPLLKGLAEHVPAHIRLEAALDSVPTTRLHAQTTRPPLEAAPLYRGEFERRWGLGSFSALVRDLDASAAPRPTALSPTERHQPAADETADGNSAVPAAKNPEYSADRDLPPWRRFPGGRLNGNFLHDQLQWLASEGFALDTDPAIEAGLRRRCARAGLEKWADALVEWMRALLATRLPHLGVALKDLHVVLPEMEFWMPSAQLQAPDIDTLCQRHLLDGAPRPPLPQRTLNGMLLGFVDLVFEHQGRYWVLDYKSNSLGQRGADYDSAALRTEMAHHRYDVQGALYLLALHRLLRTRLGTGYDPREHLGGALYFFIRGIDGPVTGELALPAARELLEMLDALDALLRDEATLT